MKEIQSMAPMRILALATLLAFAGPCFAQEPANTTNLSVWARVLFGEDGKVREMSLADEAGYPKAFADNVKARIGRASIPPPVVDGKPVTMRTGVELRLATTTTPQGPATKVTGLTMSPFPLKRDFDLKQPNKDGAWSGEISATCIVSVEGKCGPVEVQAAPATPETIRRYAKSTLERLQFEPQRVGDKPIEGEFTQRISVVLEGEVAQDFRDPRRVR
jgi:hypothetical protein